MSSYLSLYYVFILFMPEDISWFKANAFYFQNVPKVPEWKCKESDVQVR